MGGNIRNTNKIEEKKRKEEIGKGDKIKEWKREGNMKKKDKIKGMDKGGRETGQGRKGMKEENWEKEDSDYGLCRTGKTTTMEK